MAAIPVDVATLCTNIKPVNILVKFDFGKSHKVNLQVGPLVVYFKQLWWTTAGLKVTIVRVQTVSGENHKWCSIAQ